MNLSEHFTLEEFERSSVAQAKGIDNRVPSSLIPNLSSLCENVLEPLRTFAGQPIIISSGYRCPALNKAVGGVPNSQHQTGEAVDIHIPDNATGMKWFTWMMDNLKFDQLIKEKATKTSTTFWIHVSLRANGNQRQHVIYNLIKNPNA